MDLSDLAPVATLVVATVALYVGLRTIRQRDLADRREHWWDRFRWAADLILSEDARERELGFEVMDLLATSSLAGAEELEMLEAGMTAALAARPDLLDAGGMERQAEGEDDAQDDEGRSHD